MTFSSIKIIKSKTRASILELFFNHPENEYYLRQIESLIGYSVGNIRREMTVLESDGLFSSRNIGRMRLYKLNKAYPLFDEIKGIIRKTIGMEGGLKKVLSNLKNVDFAFIYGSFSEGRETALSDIDIIVIGGIKAKEIKSLFFEYQSKTGREINSIVYTKEEFLNKIKTKNHFIMALLKEKKIFIKGNENEFRRFIQIRQAPKT
jgi:uncharacterized protein